MKKTIVFLLLLSLLIPIFTKPEKTKFLSNNEENSQNELIKLRSLDDVDDEEDDDPDGNNGVTGQTAYHKSSGGLSTGGVVAITVCLVVVVVAVIAILFIFKAGAFVGFSSAAVAVGTSQGAMMGGNSMTATNTMMNGHFAEHGGMHGPHGPHGPH